MPQIRSRLRALVAGAVVAVLGALLVPALSAPAHAADYYRYWAFYVLDGETWNYSNDGVAAVPQDGSTIGFRYAAPAAKTPNLPRADPAETGFDTVCADTPAEDGRKRIAVLVDYGVSADAEGQDIPDPIAGCAQVAPKATALQALTSVVEARTKDSGSLGQLLCGIDGYPADGCADVVSKTATPPDGDPVAFAIAGSDTDQSSDSADDTGTGEEDSSSQTLLYVGLGVLVLVVIAGGVLLGRRRGSAG